jgi:hypothetical protein
MDHVNGARRTVTLELLLEGDGLSGHAFSDDGAARDFTGRVGLMHAIDELLAQPGAPDGPLPQASRTRPRRSPAA